MANLRKWSSTATGNASVAGGANTINFAEGQTPGSVNNSAREMMAQVRKIYEPDEWGWVEFSGTASVASQTSFKIAGDQTTQWAGGRRYRLRSGSTTRYGSVISSSYTTETTVTVSVDSGSLSASHSLAALSILEPNQFNTRLARRDATNSYSATQVFGAGFSSLANGVISVTDNTNPALRVTQLGTADALRVEDSANPDGSAFLIDNAGRVLVGAGNSTDPGSRQLINSGTSSGNNYQLGIAPESGALGRNAGIVFGATYSDGWGGGDVAVRYSGAIGYGASGGSSDPRDFSMRFLVSDASDVPTERLRITNTGAVLAVSAGGIGYGTGTGGTVTQLTSKSTGVTLNKTNGQIITHNASLGAASEVSFTVTNSTVAATDTIILSKVSGGTATRYQLYIGAVAAGSFVVAIRNVDATAQSDAITFNFAVIKAVTS